MRKVLLASVAAMGMAFAGPALANCEAEIADAEAALQADQTLDATMQQQAAASLAEAEASLAAGDEMACIDAVTQVQAMLGDDADRDGTTVQ